MVLMDTLEVDVEWRVEMEVLRRAQSEGPTRIPANLKMSKVKRVRDNNEHSAYDCKIYAMTCNATSSAQ